MSAGAVCGLLTVVGFVGFWFVPRLAHLLTRTGSRLLDDTPVVTRLDRVGVEKRVPPRSPVRAGRASGRRGAGR